MPCYILMQFVAADVFCPRRRLGFDDAASCGLMFQAVSKCYNGADVPSVAGLAGR